MEIITAPSAKIELNDRILCSDGDSIVSEDFIQTKLLNGESISGLCVECITPDIESFNRLVPHGNQIKIKEELIPTDLSWNVPQEYKALDVFEFVLNKLDGVAEQDGWKNDIDLTAKYEKRIATELQLYISCGLIDVLRTVIYIINTFRDNNIIWGGRGSSVSSYVLYIIGVHDVDSLLYDIDISDFLG